MGCKPLSADLITLQVDKVLRTRNCRSGCMVCCYIQKNDLFLFDQLRNCTDCCSPILISLILRSPNPFYLHSPAHDVSLSPAPPLHPVLLSSSRLHTTSAHPFFVTVRANLPQCPDRRLPPTPQLPLPTCLCVLLVPCRPCSR